MQSNGRRMILTGKNTSLSLAIGINLTGCDTLKGL